MPSADVVVVGAGLAGMTAAIALAEAGARVEVVARGHAATHWAHGAFDVAAPPGAGSAADGLAVLAARDGHPYAMLGDVEAAVDWLRGNLGEGGLAYAGSLGDPLATMPTAIGGTRPVSTVPDGQAEALRPWPGDEPLIVCGIAGFKDFWPAAIAASLVRPGVWPAGPTVEALTVDLPGVAGRRNLSALHLARLFDDASWRTAALETIASAVERTGGGHARIALPAVLGLDDHQAVLADVRSILPFPAFEVPLVPPSVPGVRLFKALRTALRERGGRIGIGEEVTRIERDGKRVTKVVVAAATRERPFRTGAAILATGGIAGGGLVGRADGSLEEPLFGLHVEAPPVEDWLAADAFDAAGHGLEVAGIRTDDRLRPLDRRGRVAFENVAVVGSQLAGQRYLVERCGDGVAIASGRLAATVLAAKAGNLVVAGR